MLRRLCPVCCAAICACGAPESPPPPKPETPPAADVTPSADVETRVDTPNWADASTLPDAWVELQAYEGLRFDIAYATANNFTGAIVPGYERRGAWLHRDAAAALHLAHVHLQDEGWGILIFDAYRPRRASEHFVAWAETNGRASLVSDGYIAKHSLHNQGIAVDLGLYQLADDTPVDMGGPFDSFDARAHFTGASGEAMRARRVLREAMQAQGFRPYGKEWWHFTYAAEGFVAPAAKDLPYL